MDDHVYPLASHELSHKRQELAPETEKAFRAFSKQVFADGALTAKIKQIIAVAVAHVTQCPYCIRGQQGGAARGRAARRADGGDLGIGGNGRRRRLRARDGGARGHGGSGAAALGEREGIENRRWAHRR